MPTTSLRRTGWVQPSLEVSAADWNQWAGLIMMFFGECGNFLGYGFAPASIISPLGVVALISNCVIAPLMLKEPFRKRDLMGVLVSVAGAVVVVWSAEKEETKLGPDEILDAISQTAFEVYFGITCALIIALMRLSSRYGHKTILIDLGLVGLFGGYTVLATKGISSLISSSFYHIFQYPIAYLFTFVLASTAVLQVKYINRALQRFDSTQVIPTQFVLFTISVIVGSAILYRDFEDVSKKRVIKFCAGCSLTFIGVYLISSKRQHGASRSSSFTEESDSDLSSDLSGSHHIDAHSGIPIPPPSPAIRPPFYRTVSAVSSNAVSLQGTPTLSSSPEALAQGLQTAAQDSLFSPQSLHSHHHHHRKRGSETEAIHRALGLAPGSNLMTGYQLQSVLADRVTRARTRDGEREESEEGEATGSRGRSSSLSLMLDFVKGKLGGAAAGEEAVDEEDNNGEEGRA
jgi:drug/metabolite transporter (DMT)-like permease